MSSENLLSTQQRSKFRRILASALIGNMLEFYDLFVYGFLAVVIAKSFFRQAMLILPCSPPQQHSALATSFDPWAR